MADVNNWTMQSAIEQIEGCGFECEAGPLGMNAAFVWLKDAFKNGPEFAPGEWVWFEIEATTAGKTLRQWVKFQIVGLALSADCDRNFWTYSLSYDPIGPWHNGKAHFTNIRGDRLSRTKPEQVPA